ncbi:Uma2 family endonuclease [Glycomyces salinus]|uniref:Uma2 family endonuclease n=1 Tax=Glycomyces salinus TaxID=980294 RepID=UPI0018EDD812|nr:Uma2 family endonuclease [Glycomyces salinus]
MVDLIERGAEMATTELPRPITSEKPTAREVWEHLEPPTGFRAELLRGEVILSPTPADIHNHICSRLGLMLAQVALENDWDVTNTQTIVLPKTEEGVVPDLIVIPSESMLTGDWQKEPDDLLLVAEITSSSSRDRDLEVKLASYAAAGIPMYLLVDLFDHDGSVTLHSQPNEQDGYLERTTVLFGGKLHLPQPFDMDIDTTKFGSKK